MTVIKQTKKHGFPSSSGNNSETESLQLDNVSSNNSSDTETANEPTRNHLLPPTFVSYLEEPISLKKVSGKKKLRRFHNRCMLQTLNEEDENENSLVVIMEPYKSPFAKLLEDKYALEFWNEFIDKSEEEQTQIIEAFSLKNIVNGCKTEKACPRISSKIKRTIKIRKNLSLEHVKDYVDDLLNFFKTSPNGIYLKLTQSYFERLLLHAIAQYHGLKSKGINENGFKKVKVLNTTEKWCPAKCFLTDFIAELRK